MTRRRVLLLGSVAVVAALAVAVWMVWPRRSVITRENIDRITDGMTLDEVEAILGGPARDEVGNLSCNPVQGGRRCWMTNGCAVWITFDDQMCVYGDEVNCMIWEPETIIDRL